MLIVRRHKYEAWRIIPIKTTESKMNDNQLPILFKVYYTTSFIERKLVYYLSFSIRDPGV